MALRRVIIFDPARRLDSELAPLVERVGAQAVIAVDLSSLESGLADGADLVLFPPAAAALLGKDDTTPRWLVGDAKDAPRVSGAAAEANARGVLLTPVTHEALAALLHSEPTSIEVDLARARSLVATSLVDWTTSATESLRSLGDAFAAHDCIVWWRDGEAMLPTTARESPEPAYRSGIAAAARISAACGGVIIGGSPRRSIIAEALRTSNTEVSGLVAIVSDTGRRFGMPERSDLKAVALRLTKELSFLSSHRRILAEGERLLTSSLHDPLTSAMTRGAFEQAVAHEVAAATRRQESLTVVLIDVVGMRKINLANGHRVGDEVLAQVASRIRACVRGNDPMGRLGGDELAVLLVGANDAQATLVARKIIYKVQQEPIVIDGQAQEVMVRAVISELGKGERSGEAAFSRCYGQLRMAPKGDVLVVPAEQLDHGADNVIESGLTAGTVVGGTYRVLHELSRGAMGVVYRGEDLGLGRAVAIKVLRADLASDRELVTRFRAEAGILASLHHNNLVSVYSLGEHAGDVYFVMELVEGQPLSEVLRVTLERGEWFPAAAVAQISLEIGDALDAMHTRGLIHRDVKPANILLDRDRDRAVLVDVGVAVKAGDQREAAGTPGFAAPESFLETQDSAQTDVYGLAATVYCMLTGRPPYGSGPAPSVIHRQLYEPLVPPSTHRHALSEAVDAVLAKGLDPSPKKRWASASTFAIALARALERLPVEESSPAQQAGPSPAELAAQMVLAPTAALTADEITRLPPQFASPTAPRLDGLVRGAHFRVFSKIVQHHLGEAVLHRWSADRPDIAPMLSPTLSPMGWFDLAALVALLHRAQEALPKVPVARQVGRGVISATFSRMFGADPTSVPVETVLAAAPTFWAKYHEWGGISVYVDEGKADVMLEGFPGSPLVCDVVAAELERIVELAGGKRVASTHTTCACHTADSCRFRVTWVMSAEA